MMKCRACCAVGSARFSTGLRHMRSAAEKRMLSGRWQDLRSRADLKIRLAILIPTGHFKLGEQPVHR